MLLTLRSGGEDYRQIVTLRWLLPIKQLMDYF